jgi:hypothetical protein
VGRALRRTAGRIPRDGRTLHDRRLVLLPSLYCVA